MTTHNLFIVHIPNTAGSTLRKIARQQYGSAAVCGIYSSPAFVPAATFRALPEAAKEKYSVFIGHENFGFLEALPASRPSTCMTILREPVARSVSEYNHVMNHAFPEADYAFRELAQLVYEKRINIQSAAFDNTQLRYLAPTTLRETPFGQCTRAHLEQAKNNLRDYFAVVGVQELFFETLFLAHRELGWHPLPFRNENLGAEKPRDVRDRITDDDLAFIREINALDIELYDFARALMLERLEAEGPDWAQQVSAFKSAIDDASYDALTHFDHEAYLNANPDVRAAGMDPLRHFVLHGQFEARPGSPPLDNPHSRSTRACPATWKPVTDGVRRQACPRIPLPDDPELAREALLSVRYGLMTGVLQPECEDCPHVPMMPLPAYLERLQIQGLDILAP